MSYSCPPCPICDRRCVTRHQGHPQYQPVRTPHKHPVDDRSGHYWYRLEGQPAAEEGT